MEKADSNLEDEVSAQRNNMAENSDYRPSDEDDSDAAKETFMSKALVTPRM